MSCKSRKNNPHLLPLFGRRPPATVGTGLHWTNHAGDLQDCRNRLGFNVPPCLRFIDMKPAYLDMRAPTTMSCLIQYFNAIAEERARLHGSIYRDPYGRDGANAKKNFQLANYQELLTILGVNSQGTAKEQVPQLPSKAKLPWGKLGGMQGESWTKKNAKRKVRETSEHLYQPRKPKLVSDMVMNLNMTEAWLRRKELQTKTCRRLVNHDQHGQIIRLRKMDIDVAMSEKHSSKQLMLVTSMEIKALRGAVVSE